MLFEEVLLLLNAMLKKILLCLSFLNIAASASNGQSANTKAFFEAVRAGDCNTARFMCEQDQTLVNSMDSSNNTALMWAGRKDDLEMAKTLISLGADPTITDNFEENSLFAAERAGLGINPSFAVLEYLLHEHSELIDERAKHGDTLLLRAATSCKSEVFHFLLDNGANINAKNENGENAILSAAKFAKAEDDLSNEDVDFWEYVVQINDIDSKNIYGYTPLLFAAENGNLGLTKFLLANGANTNLTDQHGENVLFNAIRGKIYNIPGKQLEIFAYIVHNHPGLLFSTNDEGQGLWEFANNQNYWKYLVLDDDPQEVVKNFLMKNYPQIVH